MLEGSPATVHCDNLEAAKARAPLRTVRAALHAGVREGPQRDLPRKVRLCVLQQGTAAQHLLVTDEG